MSLVALQNSLVDSLETEFPDFTVTKNPIIDVAQDELPLIIVTVGQQGSNPETSSGNDYLFSVHFVVEFWAVLEKNENLIPDLEPLQVKFLSLFTTKSPIDKPLEFELGRSVFALQEDNLGVLSCEIMLFYKRRI